MEHSHTPPGLVLLDYRLDPLLLEIGQAALGGILEIQHQEQGIAVNKEVVAGHGLQLLGTAGHPLGAIAAAVVGYAVLREVIAAFQAADADVHRVPAAAGSPLVARAVALVVSGAEVEGILLKDILTLFKKGVPLPGVKGIVYLVAAAEDKGGVRVLLHRALQHGAEVLIGLHSGVVAAAGALLGICEEKELKGVLVCRRGLDDSGGGDGGRIHSAVAHAVNVLGVRLQGDGLCLVAHDRGVAVVRLAHALVISGAAGIARVGQRAGQIHHLAVGQSHVGKEATVGVKVRLLGVVEDAGLSFHVGSPVEAGRQLAVLLLKAVPQIGHAVWLRPAANGLGDLLAGLLDGKCVNNLKIILFAGSFVVGGVGQGVACYIHLGVNAGGVDTAAAAAGLVCAQIHKYLAPLLRLGIHTVGVVVDRAADDVGGAFAGGDGLGAVGGRVERVSGIAVFVSAQHQIHVGRGELRPHLVVEGIVGRSRVVGRLMHDDDLPGLIGIVHLLLQEPVLDLIIVAAGVGVQRYELDIAVGEAVHGALGFVGEPLRRGQRVVVESRVVVDGVLVMGTAVVVAGNRHDGHGVQQRLGRLVEVLPLVGAVSVLHQVAGVDQKSRIRLRLGDVAIELCGIFKVALVLTLGICADHKGEGRVVLGRVGGLERPGLGVSAISTAYLVIIGHARLQIVRSRVEGMDFLEELLPSFGKNVLRTGGGHHCGDGGSTVIQLRIGAIYQLRCVYSGVHDPVKGHGARAVVAAVRQGQGDLRRRCSRRRRHRGRRRYELRH